MDTESPQTIRIRELNDAFRTTFSGGKVFLSAAVGEKDEAFRRAALAAVRSFNTFPSHEDSYGEHDFGSFPLGDECIFWTIDYYDLSLKYGSRNPSDPSITTRVLTIMLAEDC